MKAICVLEAILRKKDDEHFGIMASYFNENKDVVVKCFESPQASLREKANKVRFSKMFTLQFLALLELLQWRKHIHININAKIYVYKKRESILYVHMNSTRFVAQGFIGPCFGAFYLQLQNYMTSLFC